MNHSPYWTSNLKRRNFGDAWLELLARKIAKKLPGISEKYDLYIGGGSIISEYWFNRYQDDVFAANRYILGKVLITGAGIPDPKFLTYRHNLFQLEGVLTLPWVRGPLTAENLIQHEINCKVIGDSAEVWRLLEEEDLEGVPQSGGLGHKEVLYVPHAVVDLELSAHLSSRYPGYLSPWVDGLEVSWLIDRIKQAEFVLTGSLHIAICAFIFDTPFAFHRELLSGNESQFKYIDWCESVGAKFRIVENMAEGEEWHSQNFVGLWSNKRALEMWSELERVSS